MRVQKGQYHLTVLITLEQRQVAGENKHQEKDVISIIVITIPNMLEAVAPF